MASRPVPSELRMELTDLDKQHIATVKEKYNIQKLPDIYRFALANLINTGSVAPKRQR